jgi:hypothetical protein
MSLEHVCTPRKVNRYVSGGRENLVEHAGGAKARGVDTTVASVASAFPSFSSVPVTVCTTQPGHCCTAALCLYAGQLDTFPDAWWGSCTVPNLAPETPPNWRSCGESARHRHGCHSYFQRNASSLNVRPST